MADFMKMKTNCFNIIIIYFVEQEQPIWDVLYLHNFLDDWPYANEEIFGSLVPTYDDYGNYILHYVVRC